jgi:lipopolysaccharide biosynthesis glycosyltransferase
LYQSNSGKKFAFYFLTNNMTAKQRCLVRWIVQQFFPLSQVYTIPTDDLLRNLTYKGIKHVPIVTQSRLFLEKLLPCVNHLLWIDADAFVLDDLTELWEMRVNLPPCGVAARNSVLDNVIGNMIKVLPLHGGGKGI